MKRCPQCNRVETDETLAFCRVDGARLVSESASLKSDACFPEVINELVRTPAIRNHLAPESRKLRLLGFDVRTPEQPREDERQKEAELQWAIKQLASRYNREEIFQQIWSEPIQHVAKKYNVSDVYLAKVCEKLYIPRPGRGYWAKKSAGKSIKQPALPELSI